MTRARTSWLAVMCVVGVLALLQMLVAQDKLKDDKSAVDKTAVEKTAGDKPGAAEKAAKDKAVAEKSGANNLPVEKSALKDPVKKAAAPAKDGNKAAAEKTASEKVPVKKTAVKDPVKKVAVKDPVNKVAALAKDGDRSATPRGRLPANYGKIGIADSQRDRIYEIQGEFNDRIDVLLAQIEELRVERDQAIDKILTDGQRARLKELREESIKPKTSVKKDVK